MEYRLEFSEAQQSFHMEIIDTENENTNGYITVMSPCTDNEKNLLKSFLFRNEDGGVRSNTKVKYRHADVLEAVEELKGFIKNLKELDIEFKYN